jgi:hypothetical protein
LEGGRGKAKEENVKEKRKREDIGENGKKTGKITAKWKKIEENGWVRT